MTQNLTEVDRIQTTEDVARLATLLCDPNRDIPAVLISTPNRSSQPRFLMNEVVRELQGEALVYVIPTGTLTFALSDTLGDDNGVFAGAGRIYPPGTAWLDNRSLAPIVFAFPNDDPRIVTDMLTRRAHEAATPSTFNGTTTGGRVSSQTLTVDGPDWATVMAAVHEGHTKRQAAKPKPSPTATTVAPARPALKAPTHVTPASIYAAADPIAAAAIETTEHPEVKRLEARAAELEAEIIRLRKTKPAATAGDNMHLAATITRLEREHAELRQKAIDAEAEAARARAALNAALEGAREAGRRLARAAKKNSPATPSPDQRLPLEQFPAPEAAARHAILLAWVDRIPANEKTERPLPDYAVAPGFADSFGELTGAQTAKALRAVVDILTGREDLAARRVHPLRSGEPGNAAPHIRVDGAVCFRASIESNTASARRLHYWKRTDGTIELIRIVTHDTYEP